MFIYVCMYVLVRLSGQIVVRVGNECDSMYHVCVSVLADRVRSAGRRAAGAERRQAGGPPGDAAGLHCIP